MRLTREMRRGAAAEGRYTKPMSNKRAKIITVDGIVEAEKPIWFTYANPAWLAKHRFFTNVKYISPGEPQESGFSLTEPITKRAIAHGPTRAVAKKIAYEAIVRAGRSIFIRQVVKYKI